jgi:hypothetical protein
MKINKNYNCRAFIYIKIANISLENAALFKCLETTIANQNLIKEETKRRLNSVMLATNQSRTFCGLVCCLKNIKIGICRTIILPVVLYGCET